MKRWIMTDLQPILDEIDEFDNEFFLQTETLLPVQFHGARRRAAIEPERRLMLAHVSRCCPLLSVEFGAEPRLPAKRREYAEAQSWIFSDDDSGVLSFGAVCDALEIDPKAFRKGLLRWEPTKHATGSKNKQQLDPKGSPPIRSRGALLSRLLAPAVALAMLITVAGCSGSPLSTREKGTGIGALAGAATGAIIGAAVGAPGAGAAIGGGLGAGGGFLVGNELQNQEVRNQHTTAQIESQQREIEQQRRQIQQLKQQQELE
jgi:hypothetical protein